MERSGQFIYTSTRARSARDERGRCRVKVAQGGEGHRGVEGGVCPVEKIRRKERREKGKVSEEENKEE